MRDHSACFDLMVLRKLSIGPAIDAAYSLSFCRSLRSCNNVSDRNERIGGLQTLPVPSTSVPTREGQSGGLGSAVLVANHWCSICIHALNQLLEASDGFLAFPYLFGQNITLALPRHAREVGCPL